MSETASPFIIDTTSETFEADVVSRSNEVPVVIDFWAEWCAPCKRLGPILESLAREYAGKFILVKVDTEKSPDIAAGFNVQSIPAVFAVRDGRVIDSFVGLLPEASLRAFVEGLFPSEAETAVAEGFQLEATDSKGAEACYRRALKLAPDLPTAEIGLARVLLARGEVVEVKAWLKRLEARGFLEPEAERIKAELALREGAESVGGLETVRAKVEADPKNLQSRFELAEALASAGQHEEALTIALDLVERDPKVLREPARKLMLNIFQLLPPESEILADFRRQLSSAIY